MPKTADSDFSMTLGLKSFTPPTGYMTSSGHHGHKTSFTSTRSALYHGRKTKIKTTYRIEIDGEPLSLHTVVTDDGNVHYHGLPNYAFASALDMAKAIIDAARHIPVIDDELGGHHHDDHGDQDGDVHGGHGGQN